MTHKEISGPVYSIGDQVRDPWGRVGYVSTTRTIYSDLDIPERFEYLRLTPYQRVGVRYEDSPFAKTEGPARAFELVETAG